MLIAAALAVIVAVRVSQQGASVQSAVSRVHHVRLVTPLEDPAFLEGNARYSERVALERGARKVHLRTDRRYVGPPPSQADIDLLLQQGLGDALHAVLRDDLIQRIATRLRPIESELGLVARQLDVEVDKAVLALAGTEDEVRVRRSDPDAQARIGQMTRAVNMADHAKERYVNVSRTAEERWYHIRKDRFPRVFDLQSAHDETLLVRRKFLDGEVRLLIEEQGTGAIEVAKCSVAGGGR